MPGAVERIHATAVAVLGKAALIRGAPGTGKSDLALRCLATAPTPFLPYPAQLVADDQVVLERRGSALFAFAPDRIAKQLEIRGLGIVEVTAVAEEAEVILVVELAGPGEIERMPDPWPQAQLAGVDLPVLRVHAAAASAHIIVLTALMPANLTRLL